MLGLEQSIFELETFPFRLKEGPIFIARTHPSNHYLGLSSFSHAECNSSSDRALQHSHHSPKKRCPQIYIHNTTIPPRVTCSSSTSRPDHQILELIFIVRGSLKQGKNLVSRLAQKIGRSMERLVSLKLGIQRGHC